MATVEDVATALLAHAAALSYGSPVLKKAMPDVAFTPESGKPYFRVDLFRNAPFWVGLGNGKIDQGLMQVTVVWPKGQGIIKASKAADAVISHFAKGLKLATPSGPVKLGQAYASAALPGDAWTDTPVTIPWTA